MLLTALSGVFGTVEPSLSLRLPDRLDTFEKWETAWMEMDLCESRPALMHQSSKVGLGRVEYQIDGSGGDA